MFLYFEGNLSQEDHKCIFFNKGHYYYSQTGTKDMHSDNPPVMWNLNKLLRGEYPSTNETPEPIKQ